MKYQLEIINQHDKSLGELFYNESFESYMWSIPAGTTLDSEAIEDISKLIKFLNTEIVRSDEE